MKKRKILLLLGALLLTSCVQRENATIETQETPQDIDSQNTSQASADSSIEETSPASKEAEINTDCFSSANRNLKLVDLTENAPVYEFIIENSETSYDDTVDGQYPDIKIDPEDTFSNVVWWSEKNQIHLQLWNVNNEPTITFYLDENKCELTFPQSNFEGNSINKKISSSDNSILIESLNIYKNYMALTIQPIKGNDKDLSSKFSLKIDDENYTPCMVHFIDDTGKIILLYNVENYDLAAKVGILYNNNLIVTLE